MWLNLFKDTSYDDGAAYGSRVVLIIAIGFFVSCLAVAAWSVAKSPDAAATLDGAVMSSQSS